MAEGLNQWHFVIAAYAIGVGGTIVLVAWVVQAMLAAERRRDKARER